MSRSPTLRMACADTELSQQDLPTSWSDHQQGRPLGSRSLAGAPVSPPHRPYAHGPATQGVGPTLWEPKGHTGGRLCQARVGPQPRRRGPPEVTEVEKPTCRHLRAPPAWGKEPRAGLGHHRHPTCLCSEQSCLLTRAVHCRCGLASPQRPRAHFQSPPRGRKAASRGAVAWGPWRSLHMRWGWDLQTHVHLRMWPPHSQAAAPSPAATGVWVERLAGERAPLV